jgi:NDP-sugar pyrophosphorylase family protein
MSGNVINQAIILAGGKGTRLASVLEAEIPKSLAPINGKPVLFYQIEQFRKFGVKNILILGHYLFDQIIDYIDSIDITDMDIQFIQEISPRGTAGALYDAKHLLDDVFYLSYGDLIFDIDLEKFSERHKVCSDDGAIMTLLLHRSNHPKDADLVDIDTQGFVCGFHSYPHAEAVPNLTNSAIYIFEKRALSEHAFLQSGIVDFGQDIFPALVAENRRIGSYLSTEYLIDVGVEARYTEATEDQQRDKPAKLRLSNARDAKLLFAQYPFKVDQILVDEVRICNRELAVVGILVGCQAGVSISDFCLELEFQLASLGCVLELGVSVIDCEPSKIKGRAEAELIMENFESDIFDRLSLKTLSFSFIENDELNGLVDYFSLPI